MTKIIYEQNNAHIFQPIGQSISFSHICFQCPFSFMESIGHTFGGSYMTLIKLISIAISYKQINKNH